MLKFLPLRLLKLLLWLLALSGNQSVKQFLDLQKLFEIRKWPEGNDKQKHGLESEFCIYEAIH